MADPAINPRTLHLRNMDAQAVARALAAYDVRPAVARTVFARVQGHGDSDLARVPHLAAKARARIEADSVWQDIQVVERRRASDGFIKYLFRLEDGHQIEAVRIPIPDPAAARALKLERARGTTSGLQHLPTAKYTVCVSSQVGCALACDFCATGRMGAIRNLEPWEILAQIRHVARESDHPVRGAVFMGMGEPFLNYDNVMQAARILSDPAGMAIAANKITISTAGVLPKIQQFTQEGNRQRLVVSIGSPFPDERALLMPIEKRWPLRDLMPAIRAYGIASRQRVMLAYVAIGGRNMSRDHATALADLIGDVPVRLSLIDVVSESDTYPAPTRAEISAFHEVLGKRGIPVVRRYSGGAEIGAACGTLAGTSNGGELVPLRTSSQSGA